LAAIAESSVEIFRLDRAQGKLLVDLDVKTPTYRQGESVLGISSAAARSVAVATETKAIPAEVQLSKWPEGACASKGNPWPEHICKITPAEF
jgi:hypothetical protein